jgi:hypothetical protein
MFDVFYQGPKPNLFPFEQSADNLDHAAKLSRTEFFWYINGANDYASFDFGYQVTPWQAQFIHTWPSQWQQSSGTFFASKSAVADRQWHFTPNIVIRNKDLTNWTIPEEVNQELIDFSWHPNPIDPPYVYHFGSEYQQSVGLIYTVPGATEIKFAGPMPTVGQKSALEVLDIFFVNMSNTGAKVRYEKLLSRYPQMQSIRFANTMMDTIKRCIARTRSNKFWVISSENIYDDFDFAWHAEPWQTYMTHVFGSPWQKWSDTFLINRWEFVRHAEWANSIEEFPNLNFVKDQLVYRPADLYNIYYVDHGNDPDNIGLTKINSLEVKRTRYVDNYLDTFKRIMATATTEYVWIISSLCDYRLFDFSWQPEPWQKEMIHVFPSANQVRGDTFYIHVESFKQQMVELELLDWFNVINYCEEQRVPRWPIPVCEYEGDDLVTVIKQHEFKHPYTWFYKKDHSVVYNPSLWGAKDKKIVSFSPDNGYVLAPREAKNYISTQVYDYPYIDKKPLVKRPQQDIIFISYDEPNADANWAILSSKYPHARRLHGVEGMEKALLRAAEMSTTDWYYAVFAKTELHPDFDFSYSPDLFQEPKHYIFHAENPLNGLRYGHMGVVLYNCGLVKGITEFGIDYTMSSPHAVVPITSAIAKFNSNPYQTWRTAFREAGKLAQFCDEKNNVENSYRLSIWTGEAEGLHSEWCLQGARDGVMFYEANKENKTQLKNAFNWVWLRNYFTELYMNADDPDLVALQQRQLLWPQQ